MQSIRFDTHTQRGEAVNNEYAVSIRRSDIGPTPYDCKPIEDTEE